MEEPTTPVGTEQYVRVFCRSDESFPAEAPAEHPAVLAIDGELRPSEDDDASFVTYGSRRGAEVTLEWLAWNDDMQVEEMSLFIDEIALTPSLDPAIADRLRHLVDEETLAVAGFLVESREDLELALALAGWFVQHRDGVLQVDETGFLLDGVWHYVHVSEEEDDEEEDA